MKTIIVVLGVVVCALLIFLGALNMYSSTYDTAVNFESNIKKYYDASENDLSTYTLTIKEKTQISSKYEGALRGVISDYFNSKNGVNETNVMSFIQQHIPNLDSKIYQELMVTIDAGRTKFNNTQNMKIEQCSEYENYLKSFWNSKILDRTQFPGKNIEHYCTVVSDKNTRNAMITGIQEEIKLN